MQSRAAGRGRRVPVAGDTARVLARLGLAGACLGDAIVVGRLPSALRNIELVEDVCEDAGEILAAGLIGGCSARVGDTVESAPQLIDPPLPAAIRDFRAASPDRWTRLLRRRLQHRETSRLDRYDVLLPMTPCTAWDIDRRLPPGHENAMVRSHLAYPFDLGGQSAGSLSCGSSPKGLPIGLQFVVPLRCEAHLLAPCAPQRRRSAVRARPHLPATGLTVGCGTLSKPLNEPIGGDRADG